MFKKDKKVTINFFLFCPNIKQNAVSTKAAQTSGNHFTQILLIQHKHATLNQTSDAQKFQ